MHPPRLHYTETTQLNIQCVLSFVCFVISVAPVRYAHLAAAQVAQFTKFEGISEDGKVPELPRLHENVEGNMFFC